MKYAGLHIGHYAQIQLIEIFGFLYFSRRTLPP